MARTKRRIREVPRPVNLRDLWDAVRGPDKVWVAVGLVDADPVVDFDKGSDGDGLGPLVYVTLQPSQVECYCRVGYHVAGNGEGGYAPFVGGDEVLVVIPEGAPDGYPVIIARLNNKEAPWPDSVGGQDATTNTFAFTRARTPTIHEYAGSFMVRQAPSGAFLSFDTAGIVSLRDGSGSALQLSPDVFGWQDSDADFIFQIDRSGGRAMLQVLDARLILASSSASPDGSSIMVPGNLSIMTGSNAAAEHAASIEGVCNLLVQWGTSIAGLASTAYAAAVSAVPTPPPGSPLSPLGAPFAAALSAAFVGGLALLPAIPLTGVTPILPSILAALQTAILKQPPKSPQAALPTGQIAPGLCAPSTLIG